MAVNETQILNRLYFISGCMFVFALLVVFKLSQIQLVQGAAYRSLAEDRTIKDVVIPANRGNVYSSKGSLLATSIPKYDIRLDAVTPTQSRFESQLKPLSDSLANFFNKPAEDYFSKIRKARALNNRYLLLARNLDYSEYLRFRSFPLLNLGAYKGGLIVEQTTRREYPMQGIAQRFIGYERTDKNGHITRVGIDGAFGQEYLKGKDGRRLKQKIGKGQWKPIEDFNQVEPKDGYDVYTTLNVNIQDIAHHALLEQLEKYKADHGCVVVMETQTGEVKAISNLGRNSKGYYYERLNYAVGESHEPGSTFKLMALAVALEDQRIDTTTLVDTKKGVLSYYGNKVRDSKPGGYGEITVAKAFEVSSNTGIVSAIHNSYKNDKYRFVDGLYKMSLQHSLGLPLVGEGKPIIPDPRIKNGRWSGIALEWMAYGYGVSFTPLQTLTFYNAIANNGRMVKPRFLKEVRDFESVVKTFDYELINPEICSKQTVGKLQQLLENVVVKKHGTAHSLYSEDFSMAGKTGTCQKDYRDKEKLNYISSFVGYFPAENPKYSCIVVIHEPDKKKGYYGADVSGPVFKKIAQKIHSENPTIDWVNDINKPWDKISENYKSFDKKSKAGNNLMPDLHGMPAMDAISILENLGMEVELIGNGYVVKQSIKKGTIINKPSKIILELS
jgi:cell division protein FtsI (penicillin-binding protein 3)